MELGPENQSPDSPTPLNYLSPRDDIAARRTRRRLIIGGAITSCLTVFVSVFVFILGSLDFHAAGAGPPHLIRNALILPVFFSLAVGGLTAFQYFRGRRAFALGVLIGLGVGALIEGTCFAILTRS
jgi:hypothetical protein